MKYEAKNVGSVPTFQPTGTPWININQIDARAACVAVGHRLMTNNKWVALARNIESVDQNWNGGVVGTNFMPDKHFDDSPNNALSASAVDTNLCFGTGNT